MLYKKYSNTYLRNGVLIAIVFISSLMHLQNFSKDLMSIHVWRQTQTQSTIVNFYEEDMNILNPRRNDRQNGEGIARLEFPLMQWLTACLYKVFGNHLIITRLFMFVIGLFSVLAMYRLLSEIFNNQVMGLIGAWAFNFSPSFYYYTINPMPDNLALCFSLWGIVLFLLWLRHDSSYLLLLSGLLLSLGTLCKLPFILFYAFSGSYFIINAFQKGNFSRSFKNALLLSCCIVFPAAWYAWVLPKWGTGGIVSGVIGNEVSFPVVLDYFLYNIYSVLPELLLNYGSVLFFLAGFWFLIKNKGFKNSLFPMIVIWTLVTVLYFLFEINMIGKAHDYYLFPFYPMLFMLVAYGAYHLLISRKKLITYGVLVLLLILPLTAHLRMLTRYNPESPGFNADWLKYKTELRNAAPNDALILVGNDNSHYIYFYYVDKKGWGFHDDQLRPEDLKGAIGAGAKYLYSDSRRIDENPKILKYFDSLVLEHGSVRVFKLADKVGEW